MIRPSRAAAVDGLSNVRDLGGLRCRDGSVTPHGVLFRSESTDQVTPEGWRHLRELGIRTVVDLRQPDERNAATNRPAEITIREIDLDGLENASFWADYWDAGLAGTALYYGPHLAAMPERTAAVLRAIADAPDGGVLFHCAAGRDRTGMIAMVLQAAAGVIEEDIVDDYLESMRLGRSGALGAHRMQDEAKVELLCASLGTTPERLFRESLAAFDVGTWLALTDLDLAERNAILSWRGTLPLATDQPSE